MKKLLVFNLLLLLLFGCTESKSSDTSKMNKAMNKKSDVKINTISNEVESATLAGGCFWCMEAPFEGIDGVISVTSGYSGGNEKNPTYSEVSNGRTGHRESIQIKYDPEVISYSELLAIYWQQFDPTDSGGSFHDRALQYDPAIFYHDDEQMEVAKKSKECLNNSGIFSKPVVTKIIEFKSFYPAEEYHQDYYKKNPENYHAYKKGSGREDFIKDTWGVIDNGKYKKPSDGVLKKKLTKLEYYVTQENGTEKPFDNKYFDNHKAGIYVDIVSGEPLFSSKDKFESGTGWPSFTQTIDPRYLNKVVDNTYGMERVEVRSRFGDSHLGHVFNDGPEPTHLRYCMDSAAMNFIPKVEMKTKGYGKYLWLVD
jgi:peptide methionine sulfoxide reductase msrA/msrB